MDLGNGLGHLTYSTLVHPGDNWDEMWNSLTTFVPRVKERIAPNKRFGISLRLAAKRPSEPAMGRLAHVLDWGINWTFSPC